MTTPGIQKSAAVTALPFRLPYVGVAQGGMLPPVRAGILMEPGNRRDPSGPPTLRLPKASQTPPEQASAVPAACYANCQGNAAAVELAWEDPEQRRLSPMRRHSMCWNSRRRDGSTRKLPRRGSLPDSGRSATLKQRHPTREDEGWTPRASVNRVLGVALGRQGP